MLQKIKQERNLQNDHEASITLQKQMQAEVWPEGLTSISKLPPVRRNKILPYNPFVDPNDGLIKARGRLQYADITFGRKYPTFIPKTANGDALIGYIHANNCHTGRKQTTATIRHLGFLAEGGRRRIDPLIESCVHCRILRAPTMSQKIAPLPSQRLCRTPPFLECGMDVFGPFDIRQGRPTRKNPGTQKIWVLIFTCLYSRAIHMEILDTMSTPSFKMAFERFQATRGECNYLRSDNGSNFMGARNETVQITKDTITQTKNMWEQQGKTWEVNPPLASLTWLTAHALTTY